MSDMRVSVRLFGIPVGWLEKDTSRDMVFRYAPEYLRNGGIPLSQSLPLREAPFEADECAAFFAGLLPDSTITRSELARVLQISSADDFSLLTAIGRDCAGAVSIQPENEPVVADLDLPERWAEKTEDELAEILRYLPTRPLYYDEDDNFFFSLAGVHDKLAVLLIDGRITLPTHHTPSSHILKIDIANLPGSILTENFCLTLARRIGLNVPQTRIGKANDISYMLIERYDRKRHLAANGTERLRRVHQEDFCQANNIMPDGKYEKKGGPGFKTLFDTINKANARPATDILHLLGYAAFNLAVGNPDAHGKNFSLVYRNRRPELSPLYDVNCAHPFRVHYKRQIPRLAMHIGHAREMPQVDRAALDEMAAECGLNKDLVLDAFRNVYSKAAEMAPALRDELRGTSADSDLLGDIVDYVTREKARLFPDA